MIFFVFFLIVSAANLVKCGTGTFDEVEFPVNILLSDLDAIEKYNENIDYHLDTYIYWPNNVTFLVKRIDVEKKHFLAIDLAFTLRKITKFNPTYNGLAYREGNIYAFDADGDMKSLGKNDVLSFRPVIMAKPLINSHLAIIYKSLEEIQTTIKPFFTKHRSFITTYSELKPSTYLATWNNPTDCFLEYSPYSTAMPPTDGGLMVLVGKVKNNRLKISGMETADRMMVNQWNLQAAIHKKGLAFPSFIIDAFGVRMATVGFMQEVREGKVRMLSYDDVKTKDPVIHVISMEKVLEKTKALEPRLCDQKEPECESGRPEEVKFQIYGHVFIKMTNYQDAEKKVLEEECPFIIKFESGELDFWFGGNAVSRFCTDDKELWAADSKKSSYDPKQDIVFGLYPPEIMKNLKIST